jgi:hypothetical protein
MEGSTSSGVTTHGVFGFPIYPSKTLDYSNWYIMLVGGIALSKKIASFLVFHIPHMMCKGREINES